MTLCSFSLVARSHEWWEGGLEYLDGSKTNQKKLTTFPYVTYCCLLNSYLFSVSSTIHTTTTTCE